MKAKAAPAVDWKKLKTARGAASRVPSLVKALASATSQEDRDTAEYTLSQGLFANGAVAPSTGPTVSLLLEVVAGGQGGFVAAKLIGDALAAGHLRWLAEPDTPIGGPIAEVRAAAVAGGATLISALQHEDARLRAAAAFALAFVPELGEASRAALRQRLATETEPDPQVSAGLALAVLCRDGRAEADDLAFQSAREAATPGARAAAALAGILHGDREIVGLGELGERLAVFSHLGMPWGDGSLKKVIVAVMGRSEGRGAFAVALLRALDAAAPAEAWTAAAELALDFGGFKERWQEGDVALPEELSETQRAIAVELARRSGIEDLGWGLPRSVRDRRRWLGLAPRGPLEKVIEVTTATGEKRWPVWKAWRELGTTRRGFVDFPEPIVRALSADELLEAYGEVCARAYGINSRRSNPPIGPVIEAMPMLTERAIAWARGFWKEMTEMLAAKSTPELGGGLGIRTAAIYVALIARGEPLPAELHVFFPCSPSDHDTPRALLQLLGPKAEEVLWAWMSNPPYARSAAVLVESAMPLLDCVPSKRVAERLFVALQEAKSLRPGHPEQYLAKMQEVAATEPAVAEVLARKQSGDGGTLTA